MKTMNEKQLSSWMSACMLVLLVSVCLFSCDQKNANAEVSRSQADDYPLLESVEIPIDTVLFRYATYFRVQGDKVVIFDLHNTDYFCHTFTYPDFEYISSSPAQRTLSAIRCSLGPSPRLANEEMYSKSG